MRKLSPAQRDHLRRMENSGRLTPTQVVEDARDEESPLHPLFEWDEEKAAAQYWIDQAREVIREVLVSVTTTRTTVTVNRYVPDPDRGRQQGYISLYAVSTDEDRRRVVLAECERALSIMRRAHSIAIALGDSGADSIISALLQWEADLQGDQPLLLMAAAD